MKRRKVETEDGYDPNTYDDLDEFQDVDYPFVGRGEDLDSSFREQRLKAQFLNTLVRFILSRIPESRLQYF